MASTMADIKTFENTEQQALLYHRTYAFPAHTHMAHGPQDSIWVDQPGAKLNPSLEC